MKKHFYFLLITLLSMLYMACDKSEQVPSYLYIKPYTLKTDYAKEGANTVKVSDAWIFVEDDLIGAYTLPAEVPILTNGNAKVTIYAGVRDNGNNNTPNEYFHFEPIVLQKTFTPTKFDTVTPVATYNKSLKFRWLEDFENSVNSLSNNVDKDDSLNLKITTTDVKYGQKCALFSVTKAHPIMSASTAVAFDKLPQKNRIYIEMDYKTEVPLVVELYGVGNTQPKALASAVFKEKSDWNKAYVNFSEYINTDYPNYSIIFTALLPLDASGNPTKNSGEARVDNIKLIHP